ncbi:RHS repeat-associated core domain-containing protein [Streptomyces sp. NPDC048566]|uniref:RHS repeat-associated core domain-containing protein n=1 Tax=Streptomyces sp. NPDC048566 TaxID=3365569 RepID=UPI00371865EB
MTLKQRHQQVDQQRFKAPTLDVHRKKLTEADAVAEAKKIAARSRSVAGAKRSSGRAAAGDVDVPNGVVNYVAAVGSEGSYRSVVGASPLGPDALVGQVFEGETLLASAEITNSDSTHDADGKLADVLHQVKVTWEVGCGPNVVAYDSGQVVTAHSGAYSLVHPEVNDPVVTLQASVDPTQCAGVQPNIGNFSIKALATVVDVAGGRGGVVTVMTLAHGIPTDQTYACAPECASLSTAFAQPQAQRGASVNTATGAFSGSFTDAQQSSVGGGLDLTRRYSSDNTAASSLGQGWTLPWDAQLAKDADGNITYTSESGAKYPYTKKSDGTFTDPATSRSALKSLDDGTYTLTTPDKRTLSFDSGGHLTSSKNRSGQGVTYRYAAGHLASVTDAAGRTSTATYSGDLLSRVQLADGRHVDYGYTASRLTSVTGTDAKQITYGYDTGGRLNSIQDAAGHYPVRSTYDSQGRVATQKDALGNSTSYTYRSGETDTTAPDGGVWTDVYAHNYLLVQYDPFGNRTFYNYDGTANLIRATDPLGHFTSYAYDTAGRLTTETAPSGARWQYAYDTNGNLSKSTDPEVHATTYTYTTGNLLATVKDPLANVTTFTYTATGQLATETDPLQKTTTYGYDTVGNQTSVKSPSGATTTQTFDASGRVATSTDARGNASGADPAAFTTKYTYDDADRLLTTTDPKGRVTKRGYDAVGNLTSVTDATGKTTSSTYDAANRATGATDAAGNTGQQSYDAMGRLLSATDTVGSKTTYTYDKAGRALSMTMPRGNAAGADAAKYTWKYGYDVAGNKTTVTDPLGYTTATTYTADNLAESVTDPLGNVRKYSYDDVGNVLRATDALNRIIISTYNANNQVATVRDRNSKTITYSYDTAGRLASETSPMGNKTTYGYNSDGLLTDTVEPRGNVTGADPAQYTWHTSYDAAGNVTGQTDPLGNKTSSTYDTVGNVTESTDALGKKTGYGYDDLDRLTKITAPDGGITTLGYDAMSKLTSRLDPNRHTTAYAYDKAGHLTKTTDPLNRATSYAYDADGNRTTVTNARSQTIISTFDSRGLPSKSTYSDGTPSVTYTYDAAGRVATVADGTGTRTLTYDAESRPLTITSPGAANPFKYTYNGDGTVRTRTYPDGYAISYVYDADGRIKTQSTSGKTITYGWDQAGNLTSAQLPTTTALTESRTYDRAGNLASVSEGTGARQFTRDPDGRVVADQFKDATTTGLASRYGYDGTGRLTRACTDTLATTSCLDGTSGTSYGYDKVGNLTTSKTSTTTVTNTFDAADQLTKRVSGSTTTNLTYDTDGNLTKDATGIYTYDAASRIKSATIGANSFTFGYDADGNRTTSNKNGTRDRTTRWDLNNPLAQIATDTNSTGALIADHNYNPTGIPQAVNQTTGVFYLLHDRQNSVRSVNDATGKETYTYSYSPWGETTGKASTTNGQTSVFGYTGQYKDPYLTGHLALRARSYDPATARFATTDPVPAPASSFSPSPYAYAGNDPVNQADPSGQCPLCVSAGIGAAFGAVLEGGVYSWQHRNGRFTWGGLAKASGEGALTGAIAGVLMPGAGNAAARGLGLTGGRALATSTVVNASVGAAFSWGVNEAHCRPTGPWDLIFGAAGGGSSSLLGPAFSWLKGRFSSNPSGLRFGPGAAHADDPVFRGGSSFSLSSIAEEPGFNYLYRGVSTESPAYNSAVHGIAEPRGGSASMQTHHDGNTDSIYTSWSTSKQTALTYARGAAEGRSDLPGVILQVKLPLGQPIYPSIMFSTELWESNESLVEGIVRGAKVFHVPAP